MVGVEGVAQAQGVGQPALAATPVGRGCALAALTAVAYTPAGTPLLGGTCDRAGTAGIFSYADGTWQLTGPALPATLAGQRIQVLRLTRTGSTDTALLEAGQRVIGHPAGGLG